MKIFGASLWPVVGEALAEVGVLWGAWRVMMDEPPRSKEVASRGTEYDALKPSQLELVYQVGLR
jgi:hypothetical protein